MTSDDLERIDSAIGRIKESGARLWTEAEIEYVVRQTLANAFEQAWMNGSLTNDQ